MDNSDKPEKPVLKTDKPEKLPPGQTPQGYIPQLDQSAYLPGSIKQRHLVPSPTQPGDMYYGLDGTSFTNVAIGVDGSTLTVLDGVPVWAPAVAVVVDGWTAVTDTWTYASASTITVPTGAALLYQVGDRIKFTQTTVKYGTIIAVADTVLTIAINTDYTVANAVITAPYYSHVFNPIGYPDWFATAAPTWDVATFDDGAGGQPTTSETRIRIAGHTVQAHCRATGVKAGTNYFILFASSIFPTSSHMTIKSDFGVAHWWVSDVAHVGTVYNILNSYAIVWDANITDNQALTDVSFNMTYEI